jgi:hypothetical protein
LSDTQQPDLRVLRHKENRIMKKPTLIIGFALFGAFALAAAPSAVFAQAKAEAPAAAAPAGDDNVQYKAKTVYDFEDDTVEGDLQRPDGELVSSQKKAEHSSLIEIRKDFIPEMLKSLEDV